MGWDEAGVLKIESKAGIGNVSNRPIWHDNQSYHPTHFGHSSIISNEVKNSQGGSKSRDSSSWISI
jgi:hypothetical protein